MGIGPLPLSLGSFLASPVGRIAAASGRSLAAAGVLSMFSNNNPATREIYYNANWATPNLLPDPSDLIGAFNAGRISRDSYAHYLRYLGIDVDGDEAVAEMWRRVTDFHRGMYDLGSYKKWYRQGRLTDAQAVDVIRRHGFAQTTEASLWLGDYEPLPIETVHHSWRLGEYTHTQTIDALGVLGWKREEAEQIIRGWSVRLSPLDTMQLFMRGRLTVGERDEYLKAAGISREVDRSRLIELASVVPTPSDAILMAVHDVFEPTLLGKAEMLAEYANQKGLRELFRAAGITTTRIAGINPAQGDNIDVGELYWLAHYRHESPTQAYEQLHRLRAGRVQRLALPGQTPEQVQAMITDISHVRQLLKLNDVNPFWRDRLAAIAYHPIGRIDLRRMYRAGVFGPPKGSAAFVVVNGVPTINGPAEQEVYESFQDQGYAPPDAYNQALVTAIDNERSALTPIRQAVKTMTCEAIELGLGTTAEHKQNLAFAGWMPRDAEAVITMCTFRRDIRYVKRAVKLIRRAYLGGRIGEDTAQGRLNQLQIQPERVTAYMAEWNLELTTRAKEPQAAVLCQWYGSGLLSLTEFAARLTRLGWSDADRMRVIAHCLIGVQARSLREQKQAAALAERKRKEADRIKREELRRFLAGRTDEDLKRWYSEGVITEDDIRYTLKLRGYANVDIERHLCDITGKYTSCRNGEAENEESVTTTTSGGS